MRFWISTCIFVLFVNFAIAGGDSTIYKNSISISAGPAAIKRQDLIFSPFIYDEFSFAAGLHYHHSAKFEQDVRIGYSAYSTETDFTYLENGEKKSTGPHTFNLIDIDYSLSGKIYDTGKFTFFGGGTFANEVDALNYNFGFAEYFGYFASFGLNATASGKYVIDSKNEITSTISIPVVTLVARSPYLVNDDEFMINSYSHSGFKSFFAYAADGTIQTVNHFQKINFELGFERKISKHWKAGFNYNFEFIHYSPVAPFTSIENKFLLTSKFNF